MDSIIKVTRLSHRYSVQWAVRNISFELPASGIYGLLGSNGAGKSTLMNIICGAIKPTRGEVRIRNIDVATDPVEAKKHIGFLPQKPPLYGDLTVEEYLRYAADLRWVPAARVREAIDEVLEMCAITHFRKRLIRNLSGGYQQRVGIAQAIIHKPELVVFDEPTNGLDPKQIIEIRDLIRNIARERTVILSTHILTEVRAVCEYILMIEQGELVFSGKTADFDNYLAPSSLFVSFADAPDGEWLESVPGVTGVEELGGGRFRVHFCDGEDIVDMIAAESSSRQWHLQELYREEVSPDKIFSALAQKKTDAI